MDLWRNIRGNITEVGSRRKTFIVSGDRKNFGKRTYEIDRFSLSRLKVVFLSLSKYIYDKTIEPIITHFFSGVTPRWGGLSNRGGLNVIGRGSGRIAFSFCLQ